MDLNVCNGVEFDHIREHNLRIDAKKRNIPEPTGACYSAKNSWMV
jgi:hypothetical protein